MASKKESKNLSNEEVKEETKNVEPITDAEKIQKIVSSLKTLLETGDDWQRKATSVPGVSVLRLPQTKTRSASIAVEINPLNKSKLPMKKKGVMILNLDEVEAFRSIFTDQRLPSLIEIVSDVSGTPKRVQSKTDEEVLQI